MTFWRNILCATCMFWCMSKSGMKTSKLAICTVWIVAVRLQCCWFNCHEKQICQDGWDNYISDNRWNGFVFKGCSIVKDNCYYYMFPFPFCWTTFNSISFKTRVRFHTLACRYWMSTRSFTVQHTNTVTLMTSNISSLVEVNL